MPECWSQTQRDLYTSPVPQSTAPTHSSLEDIEGGNSLPFLEPQTKHSQL